MRIILLICLFLATQIHAGINRLYNNAVPTSPPIVSLDKMLTEISASCLSARDHEQLAGNVVTYFITINMYDALIDKTVITIGRTELRAALNFASKVPWGPLHNTEPSEEELASATTLEAYYDLKEPRNMEFIINDILLESNIPPAIAFLDKRFPSIRIFLRREFQEMVRSNEGEMKRESIDNYIDRMNSICLKITRAFYGNKSRTDSDCLKMEEE